MVTCAVTELAFAAIEMVAGTVTSGRSLIKPTVAPAAAAGPFSVAEGDLAPTTGPGPTTGPFRSCDPTHHASDDSKEPFVWVSDLEPEEEW